MTSKQTASDLQFEPPGPGAVGARPRAFPASGDALLGGDAPEPFQRGVREFMEYYGMLLGRWTSHYVNGFAYRQPCPVADDEVAATLPAGGGGLRAEALARAAARLGRDTSSRPRSRRTASCSRSIPTRSPTTS